MSYKNKKKKRLGFTTTIPIEVVLAAGYEPVDLNNIFITDSAAAHLIEDAEIFGFPRSSCAWIKGIHAAVEKMVSSPSPIDLFVAVTEGDCSNARVLKEIVETMRGVPTYLFSYPHDRSRQRLRTEIARFASFLGTTLEKAEEVRTALRPLRKKLERFDELSWRYPGVVPGLENHLLLVSASDFGGDLATYRSRTRAAIAAAEKRLSTGRWHRYGKPFAYLGVPPIFDLYSFLEEKGAIVVFNEMQREFAMLGDHDDLVAQYRAYSYPYSAEYRFSKAIAEIKRRHVLGIIHYVQAFCHRQIEDIILRRMLKEAGVSLPLLTLEGDKPQKELSGPQKTRLEAFVEML